MIRSLGKIHKVMRKSFHACQLLLAASATCTASLSAAAAPVVPTPERVEEVIDIAPVWAAHPVGFVLLTHKGHQFAAFYDAKRRATLASRRIEEKTWRFVKLPTSVGWDSHNFLTLGVDDNDCLHLSGNVHGDPLIYFRATQPLDIESMQWVRQMVGQNEQVTTYPSFRRGPNKEFLFVYRDGVSGRDARDYYNIYDHQKRTWRRLTDKPLTDGEGKRSAYFSAPTPGPDGYLHMVGVWREAADANGNHVPTYARTKDLVNWESSDGRPLALPITIANSDNVDPSIKVGDGLINGNIKIGFDTQKRPIVSYHKHAANGNTQIYNARREAGAWKIYQTSDWDHRWNFGGAGSIPAFEIRLSGVRMGAEGKLLQDFYHLKYGTGTWVLNEATLKPVTVLPIATSTLPAELEKPQSTFPDMTVKWVNDSGSSGEAGVRYRLGWETLPPNRDLPRAGKLPPPSMLRLYKLRK